MKGKLIMTGVGMDMMMKLCYVNHFTMENTILEWELNKDMPSEDRWYIYEKQ
jgi:hypothetical protein